MLNYFNKICHGRHYPQLFATGFNRSKVFCRGNQRIGSQIIMQLPLLHVKVVTKSLTGPHSKDFQNKIAMKINWIPREKNEMFDEINKLIDLDDW